MKNAPYTEEQLDFIRYAIGTHAEVANMFNQRFNDNRTACSISYIRKTLGLNNSNSDLPTYCQREWLKSQNRYIPYKTLTDMYNLEFNVSKSVHYIKRHCIKLGLNRLSQSRGFRYTDAHINYILSCPSEMTYSEIAESFNKHFDSDLTIEKVRYICKRNNIRHSYNPNQYTRETHPDNSVVVGSIRQKKNSRTGNYYKLIKYKNDPVIKDATSENWMRYSRYVYLQEYDNIPDDHVVVHLNLDESDDRIENLFAIKREIVGMMGKFRLWSTNPEITMAGITWCTLYNMMIRYNIRIDSGLI